MACPADDQLAAHLAGELPLATAEALGGHIDECTSCRAALVALVRARGTPRPGVLGMDDAPVGPVLRLGPGATLGRYRVVSTLGAGAMGVVYRAHDPALERDVALKVMRVAPGVRADAVAERMVRESRLLARVVDPAVVTIHDVGVEGGQVFLAMELVEGVTLAAWLAAAARPVAAVLDVLARAGAGLAAAHRAGVVHRDFKPDNVLVAGVEASARPARVAVTDFGVARVASVDGEGVGATAPAGAAIELTATGVAVGTPAYMAPEQLAGGTVDARADVFAFAVTAWEALYQRRPYLGATVAALRQALDGARPVAPARGRGGVVPGRVRRVLEAALARDPAARPASMAPILAALVARPRWRTAASAAALTAVVAAGAGAYVADHLAGDAAPTACARARADLAATWHGGSPAALASAGARAGVSKADLTDATSQLAERARALASVLDARCEAGVTPAPVAACVAARQLELAASMRQVDRLGPGHGAGLRMLVRAVNDPAACLEPATGTVAAAWPLEAARQDAVAAVRLRIVAVEAQRARSDFAAALAAAEALGPDVAAVGWEPLAAEHLALLGSIQIQGTNTAAGGETLRQAAALAERVHHDYVAASVWLQLVQNTAFTERDPARALEYARYADAASARLRRPAPVEVQLAYVRGVALLEHGELDAGEAELRRGFDLAQASAPTQVGLLAQGLGFSFESRGRYAEAVATYRRALALAGQDGTAGTPTEVVYRMRLAVNLANLGQATDAVTEARAAATLADQILPTDHLDRVITYGNLAEVLRGAGQLEAALAAVVQARTRAGQVAGERSELFGNLLAIEASIEAGLDRAGPAAARVRRACEILAFANGDDDVATMGCRADGAVVLSAAGDHRGARAWLDAALPVLRQVLGDDHAQVATATQALGVARAGLGDRAGAVAALEEAVARIEKAGLGPGYLAGAQLALARVLPAAARTRARSLATAAVAAWRADPIGWEAELAEAERWLRTR